MTKNNDNLTELFNQRYNTCIKYIDRFSEFPDGSNKRYSHLYQWFEEQGRLYAMNKLQGPRRIKFQNLLLYRSEIILKKKYCSGVYKSYIKK